MHHQWRESRYWATGGAYAEGNRCENVGQVLEWGDPIEVQRHRAHLHHPEFRRAIGILTRHMVSVISKNYLITRVRTESWRKATTHFVKSS